MSAPENFLERWSKRKRAAADPAATERVEVPRQDEKDDEKDNERQSGPETESKAAPQTESFDVTSLPPVESIGANTDVTAFLQPGVPPELTRAALRRAWSSDPAIRDFVGLVENGWDFNDPDAMPGFGRIGASDVARLLSQAVGELAAEPAKSPRIAELREDEDQVQHPVGAEAPAQLQQHEESAPAQVPTRAEQVNVRRSENDGALQERPGDGAHKSLAHRPVKTK
jgi:hypothetical protein